MLPTVVVRSDLLRARASRLRTAAVLPGLPRALPLPICSAAERRGLLLAWALRRRTAAVLLCSQTASPVRAAVATSWWTRMPLRTRKAVVPRASSPARMGAGLRQRSQVPDEPATTRRRMAATQALTRASAAALPKVRPGWVAAMRLRQASSLPIQALLLAAWKAMTNARAIPATASDRSRPVVPATLMLRPSACRLPCRAGRALPEARLARLPAVRAAQDQTNARCP